MTLPLPNEAFHQRSVFLNVPFDQKYQPLFVALIAGLTGIGCSPRCVLEVPSSRDRLDRLVRLIGTCGASVHDLSRVELTRKPFRVPRFNMPFELGLTYMLARSSQHSFFLFEERAHRLQVSLSDLNGYDPHVHHGTQTGILTSLLDCFGTVGGSPSPSELRSLTRRLSLATRELQREQHLPDLFRRDIFRQTVQTAVRLAKEAGLIS